MIQSNRLIDENLEEAFEVYRKLSSVDSLGFIAGGYVRDILLQRQPTDIDFWSTRGALTNENCDELAQMLFSALGQTGELTVSATNSNYASDTNGLRCYRAVENDGTYEPLNVIFYPEVITDMVRFMDKWFDIGLCQVGISTVHTASPSARTAVRFTNKYMADSGKEELTIYEAAGSMTPNGTLRHILKIREKFPDFAIKFDVHSLVNSGTLRNVYRLLVNRRIIQGGSQVDQEQASQAARAILQAQTERTSGNPMGFQTRATTGSFSNFAWINVTRGGSTPQS